MNPEVKSIALSDVKLFKALSKSELVALNKFLIEKNFAKGEVVFSAGDECKHILIVRSGRVKLSRISAVGKEQILEILEEGHTCACNPTAKWKCASTMQALTDCAVWFLPSSQYERLLKTNHKLLEGLTNVFTDRLCHFCSLVEDISITQPDKRLIKFILDVYEEHSKPCADGNGRYIAVTHEEISLRLALVRETITRHLNKLKRLDLIDLKPQQIIVLDEGRLRQILGE